MGGTALDSFTRIPDSILLDFIKNNRSKFGTDTGIFQKALRLFDPIVIKKLEFIKLYPDLFISFWTFSHQIVYSRLFEPDTLLQFYNTILSDRYKNYKASKFLVSLIRNKIALKTGGSFPDFSVTDINNNRIELSKLKGKFVLIQFWASWCRPCIAEMPDLRAINEKYRQTDFTLVSFSIDKDRGKFQQAIERYSMNWIQVFGNNRLFDSLGERRVPALYLIDKNGHIIYNRDTTKDFDMILLKKILSEKLNK
ncbi:hypothetical protein A3860_39985 [Niastella vici]|uniref:Thioredoxin domain-containing protein n=2 Tax=Niastella vici TaxID=1703345 RepID=A0A1V9G6H8_9BACT|nr:hypothetical protein A3860_39985 [Niastella vici]